jgi:uncharacterized membrane protein YphA (DoxX/SURF4 family)
MRRLFSSFAPGAPGTGLLLLRVATGSSLVYRGISALIADGRFALPLLDALLILLGILIFAGLWTPIAGALVAGVSLWEMASHPGLRPQFGSIAIVAAGLALVGPGAWSVDAWLYGWKEIKISVRTREEDSPG